MACPREEIVVVCTLLRYERAVPLQLRSIYVSHRQSVACLVVASIATNFSIAENAIAPLECVRISSSGRSVVIPSINSRADEGLTGTAGISSEFCLSHPHAVGLQQPPPPQQHCVTDCSPALHRAANPPATLGHNTSARMSNNRFSMLLSKLTPVAPSIFQYFPNSFDSGKAGLAILIIALMPLFPVHQITGHPPGPGF